MFRLAISRSVAQLGARNVVLQTGVRGFASSNLNEKTQSFVKRLFYGDVAVDQVFPYPCHLTDDDRETLQMLVDPVSRFFSVSANTHLFAQQGF